MIVSYPVKKIKFFLLVIKMEAESQMREVKYAADISSIREAQARIKPFIHQTPVLSSESLNALAGRQLFFKCECFQKGLVFTSFLDCFGLHLVFLSQ